jgi:putative colanic acid biosynthesis acetyltransferase WcaF
LETNLKYFNNDWYWNSYNTRSRFTQVLWYIVNRLFFTSFFPWPMHFKSWILRIFGAQIGNNIVIKPRVSIKYPWFLTVGNYCWIGEGVWIDNLDKLIIGNNVCISQGAMLVSGNHDFTKATFDLILAPIVLEDGVWIGAKAVVCQGVTCGRNAILTVGSITSANLKENGIYKGIPAIWVKERIIK